MSVSPLKQARLDAGLDIADIARKLYIKRRYLIALEEEDISVLPCDVYVRGFLKKYADYLGISPAIQKQNNALITPHKQSWTNSVHLAKYQPKLFALLCLILGLFCILFWIVIHRNNDTTLIEEIERQNGTADLKQDRRDLVIPLD